MPTSYLVSLRKLAGRENLKPCAPASFEKKSRGVWYFVFFPDGRYWFNPAFAHVAQLVERVLGKDEVISSSLIMGSRTRMSFKKLVKLKQIRLNNAGDSNG